MTMISAIPPGLVLILGALLLPLVGPQQRAVLVLGLPLLALAMVWQIPDAVTLRLPFLGYELEPVKGDRLSRLFATIFAIMAFGGGLFALNRVRTLELVVAFVYAGSAIGVAFAGDLITLFVFWEIMALASTAIVWSVGTPQKRKKPDELVVTEKPSVTSRSMSRRSTPVAPPPEA